MKQKTSDKLSKTLSILAMLSFLITLIEGIFYYDVQKYPIPIFRWMLIIQNSINAFAFKSNISISNVAGVVQESESAIEIFVSYLYAGAMFVAPFCTIAYAYKIVEKFLRFKHWNWWFFKSKIRCIIFGYNEEVKALLSEYDKKKYRIHIVASKIAREDEMELLKNGITLHNIDCLKLKKKEQLDYFFKKMELHLADAVILFEDSSAKNFSLYQMFHNEDMCSITMQDDIKFYCRCEDDGIRRIIENYHDAPIKEQKKYLNIINDENEKDEEMKTLAKQILEELVIHKDLELISIPELRVKQLLDNHPLHSYYMDVDEKETVFLEDDLDKWKLHLLIVGFGKIGQQLLIQAMNQGVVSSKNPILIDVIDFDIEKKKAIFENYFNEKYVEINKNEILISPSRADGYFRVRFHNMDIRFKEFYNVLSKNGDVNGKDGLYTYVAICIKDTDATLHCMSEIQKYLKKYDKKDRVSIAIRMEYDKNMAKYLNSNKDVYKNVFAIEDTESTITLRELLHDEINKNAKKFNEIYSEQSLLSEAEYQKALKEKKESKSIDDVDANVLWRSLELVRRNSNRALSYHQPIKEYRLEKMNLDLESTLGVNGSLIKHRDNRWVYSSTNNFLNELKNNEDVLEMAKTEHRRWCYYMASCGWKRTDDPKAGKNDELKENPCLCTWEDLVEYKPDTCVYDLMPLILCYEKILDENKGVL